MKATWRIVKRPLTAVHRHGWKFGYRALISPRGTVFELWPKRPGMLLARQLQNFQVNDE